MNHKLQYILRLADNALILGQRLSEWCGHGPVLEQDIAITNIALDQVGQARSLYQYAAAMEGKGRTEDDLAYLREERFYYNLLLVEQPNEDWAFTIVRQFLFDAFNFPLFSKLKHSTDEQLAAIAEKSLKEITYHLRYSSEWMIRLGDGTQVSRAKMQHALNELWPFSQECLLADQIDQEMFESGVGPDLESIRPEWESRVDAILEEATLEKPTNNWMQSGGKQGKHTEHLGYILTELQHLQRTHPGATW